jgi:hypothetical protein
VGAKDEVTSKVPEIPTLFEDFSGLKVRRVVAGALHSAALTDEGKLYTWFHDDNAFDHERGIGAGAGYPPPDLGDVDNALCRPRCVEGALAGMRIVSVAAGQKYTIVASDQGMAPPLAKTAPAQ